MNPLRKIAMVAGIASLALAIPLDASATVKKEGAWPAADTTVSFRFEGKPKDGLKKLAEEAGWSLVMSNEVARGDHDVQIAVEDQPADAVLEALFAESNVVARRNGTLITVTPSSGAANDASPSPSSAPAPSTVAPPIPAIPAVPPVPTVRGSDRNVFGNSVEVKKDEIIHTLTVTGGSAKIYGAVTGDLVVAGGSATLEQGARVVGNVTVFGGSIHLESGSRIDGDVGVVGGSIHREEGAVIGGTVVDKGDGKHGKIGVKIDDGKVVTSVAAETPRSRIAERAHEIGQSVTKIALLFVLGCVLLALGTRRMETLRIEAASRPMRSFAMGIVGSLGAIFVLCALCITIVGIPFAVVALLVGVLAVYSSMAAMLTTFGAAVLGHKTQNPYLHLLFGCGSFLMLLTIPWVGGIAAFVVTMIAIGVLIATRFGAIASHRRAPGELV